MNYPKNSQNSKLLSDEDPQKFFAIRLTEAEVKELLPKRKKDSNKGTYGRLLVIAGSKNMAGAAFFAAKAAYRTGCGLVKVYTPEVNRQIIQTLVPEAILSTYEGFDKKQLREAIDWADAIVIGPGLSMSDTAAKLVQETLSYSTVSLLIDADGLNLIAKDLKLLSRAKAPLILTPHVGEAARLTGDSIPKIKENLLETAGNFARKHKLIFHLKDANSITALPDGTCYENPTGNNGMATAGSGDVLSGIIGSLLAQGASPETAAQLGAYLHGAAGDAAAETVGRYGLMASDIIEGLTRLAYLK